MGLIYAPLTQEVWILWDWEHILGNVAWEECELYQVNLEGKQCIQKWLCNSVVFVLSSWPPTCHAVWEPVLSSPYLWDAEQI